MSRFPEALVPPDVQSINSHHRPLRTGVGNLTCLKSSFQLRYSPICAQYKTPDSKAVLTRLKDQHIVVFSWN